MAKGFAKHLALALLATLPATAASAENITFGVIGPHEYELPVNFKDFDAFVQYGFSNFSNQQFDNSGNLRRTLTVQGVSKPVQNQNYNQGLTKFVRFITFDGLPNVGFAPEAIVPEININTGSGRNTYGIADPIFGGAVWVKPNKDSTFGFQTFIQPPIGTSNYTAHEYTNITTVFYDYQARTWDLTGNTGGSFHSTQHAPNANGLGTTPIDAGVSFFTSVRFGWKLNQPSIPVEPFFAIDYEYDTQQKSKLTNLVSTPRMEDLALGAGGVITISDKYSLTLRYSRSVYGLNEVPTNAIYMKFVSILP